MEKTTIKESKYTRSLIEASLDPLVTISADGRIVDTDDATLMATEKQENESSQNRKFKFIDLGYLNRRTKSNPVLMMQMISLYLEQTPPLIIEMKKSLLNKDWSSLYAAVHKIIPSFLIMGISTDFENIAKQVQEYASSQNQTGRIPALVLQLENVCTQACIELTEEYNTIKNKNS
jgi:HPt (histidine-containing phosphotransfer) domain-containing protein